MFSQCTLRRGRKKRQILLGKDRNKTGKNRGTTNCSDLNRGILTVGLVRLG